MNVIYNVGNWPGWLTIDMLACAKHLQDGLSMSRSHSVNALVRANGQTISFELATSHSMYLLVSDRWGATMAMEAIWIKVIVIQGGSA